MNKLYSWLGLPEFALDLRKLVPLAGESDSHYHMKYRHTQRTTIAKPERHAVPPRIQDRIQGAYAWYYQLYYPTE